MSSKPPKASAKASPGDGPVTNRHVAKGVGTTLLSRMGGLIEIVSQPLYVALFGLASFGLYTVLWAAINLAENVFDLGMTSAMQRTVPQAKNEEQAAAYLRAALIIGLVPNVAVAAFASIFAEQIAPLLNVATKDIALVAPAIRLFAWALPLWAFVEIATSGLRARHLFGAEIRLRIFWEQVIRLVLAAILFFAGLGLTGLFLAHLISLAITAVLSVRLLQKHYSLEKLFTGASMPGVYSETWKAGLSVLPANMVARLFGDAPSIVLNLILPGAAGASAAALYTIARKISSAVQLVRTAFAYVLAPLASSALRHDIAHVRTIYGYATRLISAIVLPLSVVLAAAAPAMLGFFGHDAHKATGAVMLLILARGVEAVIGASVPVLQVVSGYGRQIVASAAGLAIAIIIGLLIVPLSPLTGMAGAIGIGLLVAAAIPMAQLQIHDGLNPGGNGLFETLARASGVAAAAGALAFALAQLPHAAALPLILIVAVGAIWCSARFALAHSDRASLGKTARKLRLLPSVVGQD